MKGREIVVLRNNLPRICLAAATIIFGIGSFFWILAQSKILPDAITRQNTIQISLVKESKISSPSALQTNNLGNGNFSGQNQKPNILAVSPAVQSSALIEAPVPSPAVPVVESEIDPITGATLPCPQPNDALGQLTCFNQEVASENFVFAKVSLILQQEQGGYQAADIADLASKFESETNTKCALDQIQISALSFKNPTPQLEALQACVISSYSDEITQWKSWLQRSGAEEADRSIQDQIILERRLQNLGFLPSNYVPSGLPDSETVQAINAWKASVGLDQDGLLGDADAQALLGNTVASEAEQKAISSGNVTVEYAWIPFFKYGSCLSSAGNSIGSFIDSGIPPTDPDANSAILQCGGAAVPAAVPKTVQPAEVYNLTSPAKKSNPIHSTSTVLNGTGTAPSAAAAAQTAPQPIADPTKAAVISSWLNKN